MKTIDVIATVLLVVGGLNWGLIALFNFDLVAAIFGMSFGQVSVLSRIVYGLVGLSAIYEALGLQGIMRRWRLVTTPTA